MKIRLRTGDQMQALDSTPAPAWVEELAAAAGLAVEDLPFEFQEVEANPAVDVFTLTVPTDLAEQHGQILVVDPENPDDVQVVEAGQITAEGFDLVDNLVGTARRIFFWFRSTLTHFEPKWHHVLRAEDGIPRDKAWDAQTYEHQVLGTSLPVALIVHGFGSTSNDNFNGLKEVLLADGKYGAVLAYTYPTTQYSIKENGGELFRQIQRLRLLEKEVHIYAHSEGGLVTRAMLVGHPEATKAVKRVAFAATPHAGTPIAHVGEKVVGGIDQIVIQLVAAVIKKVVPAFFALIFVGRKKRDEQGLKDMFPGSDFLKEIAAARAPAADLFVIATHLSAEQLEKKLAPMRWFYEEVFGSAAHDGVVPEESARAIPGWTAITPITMEPGDHGCYYGELARARLIVDAVLDRAVTR